MSGLKTKSSSRVAVIGGGILGTLTALNLSRAGYSCRILEQRAGLWEGATFAGEGKIHLGYVYGLADDDTLTSLLLAASNFSRDVEHAVGRPIAWGSMVSRPFDYAVPPTSLISPEEFREHGRRIMALADRSLPGESIEYLGACLRLDDLDVAGPDERGRFTTPERAIHVGMLRQVVGSRIHDDPSVTVHSSTLVRGVDRNNGRWNLTVQSTVDGSESTHAYDVVVNCAWENSALLDAMAGLPGASPPNFRLRKFIHAHLDHPPEALTLTLGPFGDFVTFADGSTYASWYPTGLSGFRSSVAPPAEWDHVKSDFRDPEYLESVTVALAEWIPGIRNLRNSSVHARIVVASGASDIDDPTSELHQRQRPHLNVKDGWISVKSYKLSSAASAARMVPGEMEKIRA